MHAYLYMALPSVVALHKAGRCGQVVGRGHKQTVVILRKIDSLVRLRKKPWKHLSAAGRASLRRGFDGK